MSIKSNSNQKKLKSKNQLRFKSKKLKSSLKKENKKEPLIILRLINVLHMNRLCLRNKNKNFRIEFKKLISLKLYKSQTMLDSSKSKMLSLAVLKLKMPLRQKLKRKNMPTTKKFNIQSLKKNWIIIKKDSTPKANLTIKTCSWKMLKFKEENTKKLFLVKNYKLKKTKKWNLKLLEKMKPVKNFKHKKMNRLKKC